MRLLKGEQVLFITPWLSN